MIALAGMVVEMVAALEEPVAPMEAKEAVAGMVKAATVEEEKAEMGALEEVVKEVAAAEVVV